MALPSWEQIAVSDKYRTMNSFTQFQVQNAWLNDVAPQLYGPQIQDPRMQVALRQQISAFQLPEKQAWEDEIMQPNTYTMDGLSSLEQNTAFSRLDFQQQMSARQIWLNKVAVKDPEFQQLSPEEQQNFANTVLKRPPSFQGSRLINDQGYNREDILNEWQAFGPLGQKLAAYTNDVAHSFLEGFGGIVIGPTRWLSEQFFGDQNDFTNLFRNWEKAGEWASYTADAYNPVPRIVGSIAGLALGVFPKVEKFLAGGFKAADASGKLIKQAGVLEKVGTKLGATLPSMGYQIAGGATAGLLQGVGSALMEGKSWDTYLAQDATIGVAWEIVSRYVGALRMVRKAIKNTGSKMSIQEFMSSPFKPGEEQVLPNELMSLVKNHPDFQNFEQMRGLVDKDGFILKNYDSIGSIDIRAKTLGLEVDAGTDRLQIKKQGKILREFTGDNPATMRKEASSWIDSQNHLWDEALPDTSAEELFLKTPYVEMREGVFVPNKVKESLIQTLKDNNVNLSFDYTFDPQNDSQLIDTVYKIIRTQGPDKAVDSLSRIGITFGAEAATLKEQQQIAKAVVSDMKAKTAKLLPESAFFIVDSASGKLVKSNNFPVVSLEHPELQNSFVVGHTWAGTPEQITKTLNGMRKLYVNEKSAKTRLFKSQGVTLNRYNDSRALEMRLQVPDTAGINHDVILHFNSMKQAHDFIRGGTESAIDRIFKGDPGLQESFQSFKKDLWKTNRKQYMQEFLPYKYLAKQAQDQGYYLARYKGSYIVQDIRKASTEFTSFKNLGDVSDWLKEHDNRAVMQNMIPIEQDALDAFEISNINPLADPDPLRELTPLKIDTKPYGVAQNFAVNYLLPTKDAMDVFETTQVGKFLRNAELSPTDIKNRIRLSKDTQGVWEDKRLGWIVSKSKGFNDEMSEYAYRWIQGLDHIDEVRVPGMELELRQDIEEEMLNALGPQKTQHIKDVSTELETYFKELAYQGKLDPTALFKKYLPHLKAQTNKIATNMGMNVDIRHHLDQIPKGDQKAFFEFLREMDPKDIAMETNVFKLAQTYTRAMSRKLFLAPTLQDISTKLNAFGAQVFKDFKSADYVAFVDYMRNMFSTLQGSVVPGELAAKLAAEASLNNIAEKFKLPIQATKKVDLLQKAMTMATGSYLAFRPWSVAKQLTQSALTGIPLLKGKWWLEGVDLATRPGAFQRLFDLGVIRKDVNPMGGGFALAAESKVEKAITKGMEAYRWGDWVNRAVVYYGMEARVKHFADLYSQGRLSPTEFLRKSGAHLFGKAQYNEILKMLKTRGVNAAADHMSRQAVAKTQYLYDKFEHPQAYRSGFGRLFGQFATWPMNYLSYIGSMMSNSAASVGERIKFMADLGVVSGAIALGFRSAGIRSERFLPWNSVLFEGGPYYQMMNDGLAALGGDQQRWGDFVKAIVSLVPFSRSGEGVMDAVESFKQGKMWEGMLHLMTAPVVMDRSASRPDSPLDQLANTLNEAGKAFFSGKRAIESPFAEA